MDNSPPVALECSPKARVNFSYRAIMPQDGLLGNIAIAPVDPVPGQKRRKVVRTLWLMKNSFRRFLASKLVCKLLDFSSPQTLKFADVTY